MSRQAKFVYQLKPGEKWTFYEGLLVVVHPDREPKVVYEDGTEEPLRPVTPAPGQATTSNMTMALEIIIFWILGVFAGYCIGWGQAKRHYSQPPKHP